MYSCPDRHQTNANLSLVRLQTNTSLTHWGRASHICVCKLTINAEILSIGLLGTNFSEILIEIHKFSFKKMRLKVSSAKWRPFCLGLNVLTTRDALNHHSVGHTQLIHPDDIWGVITHPYPKFNGCLSKPLLKVWMDARLRSTGNNGCCYLLMSSLYQEKRPQESITVCFVNNVACAVSHRTTRHGFVVMLMIRKGCIRTHNDVPLPNDLTDYFIIMCDHFFVPINSSHIAHFWRSAHGDHLNQHWYCLP